MNEYGPFASEREAGATQAAAAIRAAFDANPGVGASIPERMDQMTRACEESGVSLGDWDLSLLRQVAWSEVGHAVSLAGIVRRAWEAGKAAGQRPAQVEWGVRLSIEPDWDDDTVTGDEAGARRAVSGLRETHPNWDPRPVRRVAAVPPGPWEEVPGE